MVTITNWMYLIIPGFVYLTAIFFYILIFSRKYRLEITKEIREYLPYLSILIIFISYIIGHSFNLAFERIYLCICPSELKNDTITLNANKDLLESMYSCYAGLVLFRHLFISTLLLGIALSRWLSKGRILRRKKFKFYIIIILFEAIFALAYWGARELFISSKI